MPSGVYSRLTECGNCARTFSTHHRVCPNCGWKRPLSPQTRGAVQRAKLGDTKRCDKCGALFSAVGFGKHYIHCTGTPPRRAPVVAQRGEGNEVEPPIEPVKRTYQKSGWTVSLVNGDRQIAAKVTNEVAKRIIGLML